MSAIVGCSNMPKNKSREDIESLFSEFTKMFPVENYDFLYTKNSGETIRDDEIGMWNISTYLYTEDEEITRTGVNMTFDTQKNECRGNLYITKEVEGQDEKIAYPIHYMDSEILLVDESVDEEVRKVLEDFRMLFEIISLDKEYLSSLESTRHFYNAEVPLYGLNYKVDNSDVNIEAIKKYYPHLVTSDSNIKITLEGKGEPHNNGSTQSLYILLDEDKNNWFTASFSFTKIKASDREVYGK